MFTLGTELKADDDLPVASVDRTNGLSMIRFAKAKLKCKEVCQLAPMAVATLALLVATGNFAEAGSSRKERSIEWIAMRTAGEPIMAIVSLRSQRITVYDADGWTMRAPVSSGKVGRETPAGIFSVIQKDAEHHLNLYDDAPHAATHVVRHCFAWRPVAGTSGLARVHSSVVRLCCESVQSY